MNSFAGCHVDLTSNDISLNVQHFTDTEKSDENHGSMETIKIEVVSHYDGIPLEAMLLTKGEVAEFWFPIAFSVDKDVAVTTLTGYRQSLDKLEMAFYYSEAECTLSAQVIF